MGEFIDKVKGKAKQAEGKITGNRAREAEGIADELKGKAKGEFEELKTDVKRAFRNGETAEQEEDEDEDEAVARRADPASRP